MILCYFYQHAHKKQKVGNGNFSYHLINQIFLNNEAAKIYPKANTTIQRLFPKKTGAFTFRAVFCMCKKLKNQLLLIHESNSSLNQDRHIPILVKIQNLVCFFGNSYNSYQTNIQYSARKEKEFLKRDNLRHTFYRDFSLW